MTKESRTKIVASLVEAHKSINPVKLTRGQAFGIVVNTTNPAGETLKEKLGEDLAIELTSEVLENLGYPKYVKAVVDF
jgi:hypothetical protein